MMIHKCRSCGWPIEYPEFMAGSPAKCDECGQMQRLGQRPKEPPAVSMRPQVLRPVSRVPSIVAWALAFFCFCLCAGFCAGLGSVSRSPNKTASNETSMQRIIESGSSDFDLTCARGYVVRLDSLGVGRLFDRVLVTSNSITFHTNQQWSRRTKAEKIQSLEVFAREIAEVCPSRFNGNLKMMGLDTDGNISFTYDGPNQYLVND